MGIRVCRGGWGGLIFLLMVVDARHEINRARGRRARGHGSAPVREVGGDWRWAGSCTVALGLIA